MAQVNYFENITEPTGFVVTLDQFKEWLRIEGDDLNNELTMILLASQDKIACYLNQTLLPHSIRGHHPSFECSRYENYLFVSFRKFPVRTLTKVSLWDGAEFVDLTVDDDYLLKQRSSGFPRVLFLNNGETISYCDVAYPIIIEADIGYIDADAVPELIKIAILQYASLLFSNKGDCATCSCDSDGTVTIPSMIRASISKYKIRETF